MKKKLYARNDSTRGIDRRPDAERDGGNNTASRKTIDRFGTEVSPSSPSPTAEGCGHGECRPQRTRARSGSGREARRRLGPVRASSSEPVTKWIADALGAPHQLVRQRAAQQFGEEAAARAADHDLRDVLEAGKRRARRRCRCRRASCVSAPSASASFIASSTAAPAASLELLARPFHRRRRSTAHPSGRPAAWRCARSRSRSRRGRCKPGCVRRAGHGPSIACACMLLDQIGVDALGGAAQRQLAQRGQIAGLEEIARARASRRVRERRPCPRRGA